jgi:hypothetical protein
MIPAWARAATPVGYDVADSIHTAPGWRVIGEDFYTCVEPADCPLDPLFRRQVHEFDPDAVFLWRKQQYLPPGGTQPVTYTHNALARKVSHPRRELRLFYVEMPQNASHPRPNELVIVWEKVDARLMHDGGPGAYMPWSGQLVDYLRRDFLRLKTPKEVSAERKVRHEARLEREERSKVDRNLAWDDLNRWCARQLDKPGDTNRALVEYMRKAAQPRERKPFVYVGGA